MHASLGPAALPDQVTYRLRLLQFVALFTLRLRSDNPITSLESLRRLNLKNEYRARIWNLCRPDAQCHAFDKAGHFPLSEKQSIKFRLAVFEDLHLYDEDRSHWVQEHCGSPTYSSLRLLLPLFMELTVARAHKFSQWEMRKPWLELAGEWMLQSTLETYLLLGVDGTAIDEIFAFGALSSDKPEDIDGSLEEVQSLFCEDDFATEESATWTETRHKYRTALLPKENESIIEAMSQASDQFPVTRFELQVLAFLESLHNESAKPDLQQVMDGHIDIEGVTEEEAQQMLARINLS